MWCTGENIFTDCAPFNDCPFTKTHKHIIFPFQNNQPLLSIVLVWSASLVPMSCNVKSSVFGQWAALLKPQIRLSDKERVEITILPPTSLCSISYLNPYQTTQASILPSLSFCSTVGDPLTHLLILCHPACLSLSSIIQSPEYQYRSISTYGRGKMAEGGN